MSYKQTLKAFVEHIDKQGMGIVWYNNSSYGEDWSCISIKDTEELINSFLNITERSKYSGEQK